jgi:hypothetical protein
MQSRKGVFAKGQKTECRSRDLVVQLSFSFFLQTLSEAAPPVHLRFFDH